MKLPNPLVLGLVFPVIATCAEVYGVFTDLTSITCVNRQEAKDHDPESSIWTTHWDWSLPAGKYSPGDTFGLDLPCIQTTVTPPVINLSSGGKNYATCLLTGADSYSNEMPKFDCKILDEVLDNISVSGKLSFPVQFNAGGSVGPQDLTCAKMTQGGDNTIKFNDGKNTFTAPVTFKGNYPKSNNPGRYMRWQGDKSITHWLVEDLCPKGYKSITYKLNVNNTIFTDCSKSGAAITNKYNAWERPETAETTSVTHKCTDHSITATANNVPAGYRPTIDLTIIKSPDIYYTFYTVKYVCAGTSKEISDTSDKRWTKWKEESTGSSGDVIIYTTKTYSGSTTMVSTLSTPTGTQEKTITVQVIVPTPTTVVTSTWNGTESRTITRTATPGGTNTVIVEVPTPVTTLTETWTGTEPTTVTQSASSGGTNTVIVQVPTPVTTLTETWTGTEPTTVTQSASSGGTNTVIVQVPTPVTTLYSTWTGDETSTLTQSALSGGTNTIIIVVPTPTLPQTTYTSTWTGSDSTTITQTAASSGTDTVVVLVPTPETSLTSTWTGTETSTITQSASSGGTNTVVIVVPSPTKPQSTLTSTGTNSVITTVTQTGPVSGTDTVIVVVPTPTNPQTTVTSTGSGSVTSTLTQTGPVSGTDIVIVVVPTPTNPQTTVTSTGSGSVTSTLTQTGPVSGTDIVIVVVPASSHPGLFSLGIYWNSSTALLLALARLTKPPVQTS